MHILCLSNGHGEDVIAVNILQALQKLPNPPKISALPIVGEGNAFVNAGIEIIGQVKSMPSGGFIYMDFRQFMGDLNGGLVQLTYNQFQTIRSMVKDGVKIMAVGDIVPMIMAWLAKGDYVFVGTAKTEYYWRDTDGNFLPKVREWKGNGLVYLPWEQWLMCRHNCRGVFPRDSITATTLQERGVRAFDVGNPMMDSIEVQRSLFFDRPNESQEVQRPLKITLLPGSREPEVHRNWQRILTSMESLSTWSREVLCYAALAPSVNIDSIYDILRSQGWTLVTGENQAPTWQKHRFRMFISSDKYSDFLNSGDVAIAMAGTATEQFVGLGKPAFIIPGEGPQFTPAFAKTQQILLGESVIMVEEPELMAMKIEDLLRDPDRLQSIALNGKKRMGSPGASQRIAQKIMEIFSE